MRPEGQTLLPQEVSMRPEGQTLLPHEVSMRPEGQTLLPHEVSMPEGQTLLPHKVPQRVQDIIYSRCRCRQRASKLHLLGFKTLPAWLQNFTLPTKVFILFQLQHPSHLYSTIAMLLNLPLEILLLVIPQVRSDLEKEAPANMSHPVDECG